RIALDVDELAGLGVDELAAADGAIGAEAVRHGRAAQPRGLLRRPGAEWLGLGSRRLRAGHKGEFGHHNLICNVTMGVRSLAPIRGAIRTVQRATQYNRARSRAAGGRAVPAEAAHDLPRGAQGPHPVRPRVGLENPRSTTRYLVRPA